MPSKQPVGDQSQRPDYDQYLKSLLTRAHDDFLALIAPELTWTGERSPVLPATRREADLVWEVTGKAGERGLLHIELQAKPDADMGERVADYAIRLWRKYHLPIRSMVVYLRPATSIAPSPFVIEFMGRETLRLDYDLALLWEIPYERALVSSRYALWPLAGLLKGITPETTLDIAERLVQSPLPEQERDELIGLLLALAGTHLDSRQLIETLRRNPMLDELLRESSVSKYLYEEGKAEGKAEGMRELARVALESRFARLDQDISEAIAKADIETLRDLVSRITTVTIEEVRSRLGVD